MRERRGGEREGRVRGRRGGGGGDEWVWVRGWG